jgi:hypothetical protein
MNVKSALILQRDDSREAQRADQAFERAHLPGAAEPPILAAGSARSVACIFPVC